MEKKKGKGKMIFCLIVVIVLVIFVFGLYLWDKDNTEKMKEAMKKPALDYFDKYMSSNTGAAIYKVTLKDLKDANKKEGEEYDLSAFKKCDDDTYATINIDYSTLKVTFGDVKLNCKKF